MKTRKLLMFAFACTLGFCILPATNAIAEELDSLQINQESILPQTRPSSVLRTPMPYTKTFTTYGTARSATTQGYAYIYIKVDATIDASNDHVISIDGAWAYQADSSRNFDRWEQLSLNYSKSSTSIWAKTTGYVYFTGSNGFKDKYYIEVEKTWYV